MKNTTLFIACLVVASVSHVAAQVAVTPKPVDRTQVTLSCTQIDHRPGTAPDVITLRISYATGLVEQLAPNGKAYTNRIARNAQFSETAIVWTARLLDTGLARPVPMTWAGTLDRLSMTLEEKWDREPYGHAPQRTSYQCRVATPIV